MKYRIAYLMNGTAQYTGESRHDNTALRASLQRFKLSADRGLAWIEYHNGHAWMRKD